MESLLYQVDPNLRRALKLGVLAEAQETARFALLIMAEASGQFPDGHGLNEARVQLEGMAGGFGAFIIGSKGGVAEQELRRVDVGSDQAAASPDRIVFDDKPTVASCYNNGTTTSRDRTRPRRQ